MKKIVKKHPLAIRWFHWINFPVLAIMIWSGLLIYWANDVYKIGFGSKTLLKFFPDSFYKALHIPFRLAEGMAYHFVFMWLFFLNGLAYVLYTIISGEWRHLGTQSSFYLKKPGRYCCMIFGSVKQSPCRENTMLRNGSLISAIIVMGIGSIITGLAIYKPIQLMVALCNFWRI